MKSVSRIFLTGVLTVLPVLATFYFALWMLTAVEWFFGQQLMWLMPDEYYRAGMGLLLAIILIFIVGMLMHALLFLPREQAVPVHMSREEAMKFILTAGLKTTQNNDLA